MSSDRSERVVALNPFAQVLLTYPRRLFSTPLTWLLFFGLVAAVAFILVESGDLHRRNIALFAVWPFFGLYMGLVVHMKEQFVDARASLMPRFRRVHAEVAMVVILLAAILFPAVLAWLMGLRSIGLTALAVLLFGTTLWLTLNPSGWGGLLVGAMFLVCFTPSLQGAFGQLIVGRFEAQAWLLFALGAALTLSGFWRLVRMNEDSPGYRLRLQTIWGARDQRTGRSMEVGWPLPRRWRDRLEDRQMARLTHHARCAATSRWARACRWQVGMPSGWSVLSCLIFMLLCAVFGVWIANGKKENVSFLVILYASVFMVGLTWGPLWRRRTRSMTYEMLMPVARRDYLKQVATAAAIQQFWLWLWGAGIIVAWFCLFASPKNIGGLIGAVLLISDLAQVWIFGLAACFFRYRSPMFVFLGMMVAMYPLVIPMVLYFGPSPSIVASRPFLLAWIGLLALLGVLLTWWAYHRWLVADIDG
ncbi:MAG: hypothetical protein ABFC54_03190 [Thermoguttaceae bacterium]